MQAAALIFTHYKNESPTRLFFFRSETKEKKGDPFPLPIYKTLPKTVFGPCLQSELESRSQGKSTFVKKIGGLPLKNIDSVAKTTKIPICKNKKTYISTTCEKHTKR